MKLFHYTPRDSAEEILESGIIRMSKWPKDATSGDGVYGCKKAPSCTDREIAVCCWGVGGASDALRHGKTDICFELNIDLDELRRIKARTGIHYLLERDATVMSDVDHVHVRNGGLMCPARYARTFFSLTEPETPHIPEILGLGMGGMPMPMGMGLGGMPIRGVALGMGMPMGMARMRMGLGGMPIRGVALGMGMPMGMARMRMGLGGMPIRGVALDMGMPMGMGGRPEFVYGDGMTLRGALMRMAM
eukprot:TRINITY_DN276_c0_g1_i1.p1 TRINITY_DN276_c0_g1~~TRINITY_DN276_c0_g1_i1.p1  ORF type:complete len:247 (-),score=52.36 TRINITY_DN276_c0_g1_i1:103-843(-)